MNINTIVWIVFAVITVLALGFGVTYGYLRTGLQSAIRLGVLVATVVIAALVTGLVTVKAEEYTINYVNTMTGDSEILNELINYIMAGGVVGQSITQLVLALVAPLVFFILFIVLSIVFLIIYSIVGAFTFSQGHKRRVAKKRGERYHASKASRITSIAINLVTCLCVACMLLVPVTYYVPLAAEALDMVELQVSGVTTNLGSTSSDASSSSNAASSSDSTTDTTTTNTTSESAETNIGTEIKEGITTVASNPLFKAYGWVGGFVSNNITIMEIDGEKTSLMQTVEDMNAALLKLKEIDVENLNSNTMYTVAASVEKDPFVDKLLGGIVADAAKKWKDGESFMTIAPIDFGSEALNQGLYTTMSTQTKISESFRAVGHVVTLVKVMLPTDVTSIDSAAVLKDLANNLTADSIAIVGTLLSDSLVGEIGASVAKDANKISAAVTDTLQGLYDLKNAEGTTDEQVQKEAAAVATVFDTVNKGSNLTADDADKLVGAVKDSTIMQGVLKDMVADDNGNPLGVTTSDETMATVETALANNDIAPDSELYQTITALFKNDTSTDSTK